jgi:class 3 adenylate cyclase
MERYEKIDATVVVVDIRNFTLIFEAFQRNNDRRFIEFIENYYLIGLELAELAADDNDFYLSSSGDGLLIIFFGKNHEYYAYLYGLLLFQLLEKFCSDFNEENTCQVSFGIGIESGYVQEVASKVGNREVKTYLGSVINIASRIESTTKSFGRTKLIIGENLYHRLIRSLFMEDYNRIVKNNAISRKNYEEVIQHHNEMNKLNQNLMLFYIFEHNLKGVATPLRLFRLSPTLADISKISFYSIVKKLTITPEKLKKVVLFLKKKGLPLEYY